jgi:hypothetical protein
MIDTTNSLVLKGRPWSQSRLNQADQCALRFYWEHVNKSIRKWRVARGDGRVGRAAHWVLEQRVMGSTESMDVLMRKASADEQLTHQEILELLMLRDQMDAFSGRFHLWRERFGIPKHDVVAEKQLGIGADGSARAFFGEGAFFRGVLDVVAYSSEKKTVVILDHKTGGRRPLPEFAQQLQVYALLGFAHYPDAEKVLCAVHFLRDSVIEFRPEAYHRRELGDLLLWLQNWVTRTETRLDSFEGQPPPEVGSHCQWCEFVGRCPARGGKLESPPQESADAVAPGREEVPADEKPQE